MRAICRLFQLLALGCSFFGRTFNPKAAGSSPARPNRTEKTRDSGCQTAQLIRARTKGRITRQIPMSRTRLHPRRSREAPDVATSRAGSPLLASMGQRRVNNSLTSQSEEERFRSRDWLETRSRPAESWPSRCCSASSYSWIGCRSCRFLGRERLAYLGTNHQAREAPRIFDSGTVLLRDRLQPSV
jgi:hypothetical protein